MPLAPGILVHNRYRIIAILGQGGMGAVYRASDEHLLIPVAVKENLFLTEEYSRQFQREAHILAGLRHPNLPHVSDYFAMENQGQYLVMDYVDGEDLRQRMERMGVLPEREAVLIGISICDALTYLHTRRAPIVHRDIKPGNIKVTPDGQAVLVDFGLAKIMQGSQATSTGARAMTPGYSPPEQYGTARTDHRSDIYSLGATLYAALTGVIPEDSLARMTGKARLTPLRELAPKVNRRLAETIEHALDVDPENRFQDAEELKDALIESGELVSVFQERPTISPPPAPPSGSEPGGVSANGPSEDVNAQVRERLSRKRRKRLPRWAMAIAALALVGVLLVSAQNNLPHALLAYFTPSNEMPVTALATPTADATAQGGPSAIATATFAAGAIVDLPSATPTLTPTLLPPTATPPGGGRGEIAFASDRGGNMQIWLVEVNTLKTHQLTNQKDGACQPGWSPDGLRLAFTSPCPGKRDDYPGSNIYTITVDAAGKADQNSVAQITSSLEGDYDPAWSPDGQRIAFTSLRSGKSSIAVIHLDTQVIDEFSSFDYSDKQPAWSPSGLQLAFVRKRTNNEIWFMSDNGDRQNPFSPLAPVNNRWPAWSVDEQEIFYSQMSLDSSVPILVYLRFSDRKNPLENRIPKIPGKDSGPIAEVNPSPDGFWLAYHSWPNGDNFDVYMMNINGSNQKRLTVDRALDISPVWRPLPTAVP